VIVDAHFHCWQLDRGDYGWLTPALGPIHRDVSVADWLAESAPCGVHGGVLVQAAPTEAETGFLLAQAESESAVLGVVGWVGADVPLYASAAGKLLLAELSRPELAAWVEESRPARLTARTIVTLSELDVELARQGLCLFALGIELARPVLCTDQGQRAHHENREQQQAQLRHASSRRGSAAASKAAAVRSATRRRALRARGFSASSAAEGRRARPTSLSWGAGSSLARIGKSAGSWGRAAAAKKRLTMRSSRE